MNNNLLKTLSLACLMLGTLLVNAQNLEVLWGNETKPDKSTRVGGVLGTDENGYYISKYVGGGFFSKGKTVIDRHNMNHEVEFSNEIKTEINGKTAYIEATYLVDDKVYVFQSQKDKKTDVNKLYITIIDKSGKSTSPKVIDDIDLKKKKGSGDFSIQIAADKSKFLVFHAEGYAKKEKEAIAYKMYDLNFGLLWEKALELPYDDKKFSLGSYNIDELGNVYLYGTLEVDKKTSKKIVFAYYHKSDRLEEATIGFGKAMFISNLRFNYRDGALHFMGFYYDAKNSGIQGVCYTKINARTLETEFEKNSPINKKDLLQFTSERQAKKGKGIRRSFYIDDILFTENGDFYLVGEEYYVIVTTTRSSNGATTTTYTYYYNDIIVVKMTKDAEIIWTRKVPKLQVSTNDGGTYSSYIFAWDANNLYFMFNDHPKNTSPKTKPQKRGTYYAKTQKINKLVVNLTTLSSSGEINSEMFFKSKENGKTVLKPKYYQRFAKDKILIYAERGKTYKFGFLNIK
jgi:hypothetical protein